MNIGIDASNIRTGGGKNHLMKFINFSLECDKHVSFTLVSNDEIIDPFLKNDRIKCITNSLLNSNNLLSFISQLLFSSQYFKNQKCDIVFVPGGIFLGNFKPIYSMSQNMLPFDLSELKGFKYFKKIKFKIIRILQLHTFKKSKGIIFLTDYAKKIIEMNLKEKNKSIVIPHGVIQQKNNDYNPPEHDFNILYVSDFLPYKHNFIVAKAVSELISEGFNLKLNLIGKKDKTEYNKISNLIESNDLFKDRINILGSLDYAKVVQYYKKTSLFIFASTCENLPFIILEAMSFGLPIISSDKNPMNDIIKG